MCRTSIFARLRIFLVSLFVFSSLAGSPGATAQPAGGFELTEAVFGCIFPGTELTWVADGTVANLSIFMSNSGTGENTAVVLTDVTTITEPYYADTAFTPDSVTVSARMAAYPNSLYQYSANRDFCGDPETITGGFIGYDPPIPTAVISITNATCTGFDWSVDATGPVAAYVSVEDSTNQNMIPVIGHEGTNLFGSESYVVENESHTYFTIYVTVQELVTTAQVDSDSLEMDCSLPVAPETPTATTTVTPDPTTVTPDPVETETPGATTTVTPDPVASETPDVLSTVTPEPVPTDSPVETPVLTPPVAVVAEPNPVLIIGIILPDNRDITGAPYSIYVPEAAQLSGGRYRNGTVGANNIIREVGLIEGQYRVLIEPPGLAAVDFSFSISAAPVTELLAVVHEDGAVTVTERQVGQPPIEELTTGVSGDAVAPTAPIGTTASTGTGGSVTGLPSTGAGDAPVLQRLLSVVLATSLAGLLSVALVRNSSRYRQ